MANLVTSAVNNIVQKSTVQAATASNTIATRAAATVQAMTNKPVTSTVGAYNPTVISNVKNSLYGTGSLSDSSVHVNSIKSNINNALKVNPTDSNLLTAQKAMNSISSTSTAAQQQAALKATQTALTNLYNQSKSGGSSSSTPIKPTPTPTPSTPAVNPKIVPINPTPVNPTPTPTPVVNPVNPKIIPLTPTPVLSDSGSAVESNIRNSLFGQGSFGTTALDYNTVNKNITSALQLVSKMPPVNVVGNTTPNQWQSVRDSLLSAQKSMGEALSNKGIDDTAGRQRSSSFVQAKTELTKAEKLMNALGYKK